MPTKKPVTPPPVKPVTPTNTALADQRKGEQNPGPTKPNPGGFVQQRHQQIQGQPLAQSQQHIIINGKDKGVLRQGAGPHIGENPAPIGYEASDPSRLPNYNKLSGSERWIMNALPGISSSKIPGAGKTVGEALEWFNKTPGGKALSYLDIGAETLERYTGFLAQGAATIGDLGAMDEFAKNWKAAWYAGSLTADFAPGLQIGDAFEVTKDTSPIDAFNQSFSRAFIGGSRQYRLYFDNDMPGLDGLVRARQRIAQLTSQGMDYRQAMLQAQEEEYNSMGALAIRAQMHDTFFHLAADPINVVSGFLKPVELLHARRIGILAQGVGDTVGAAADVVRLEEAVKGTESLTKIVSEATDAAQAAQEITKAAQGTEDAERIIKAADEAGKLGDFGKLQELAAEIGAKTKTSLEVAQETLRDAQLRKLNAADRFVLWATGGAPGAEPGKWEKFNPFALTPEARAQEYVGLITENINSRIIAGSVTNGEADINKVVRAISRGADGLDSPQLGHMIATLEGQHVKSVLKTIATHAESVARGYNAAGEFERPLLKMMSDVLGENIVSIVRQAEKGEHAALWMRFTNKMAEFPELGKAVDMFLEAKGLAREMLTPDLIKSSLGVFAGDGLSAADSSLAIAEIMSKAGDAAAQAAVLRFGVKQRGLVQGIATLTKQAETLAYLKLNPMYPVKNFVNNVFTMIARGAMGNFTPGAIEDFWKLRAFVPARLAEGVGQAGELSRVLTTMDDVEKAAIAAGRISPVVSGSSKAAEVLRDATKFKIGWVNDVSAAMGKMSGPGGWDFGRVAQEIEKMSSAHALTVGYARGENMFGRVGKSWLQISDFSPELSRELGPNLSKVIESITEDAHLSPDKLDDLISGGGDLNMSASRLRGMVEQRMGRPVSSVLTDEFMASIEGDMLGALQSRNPEKIEQFIGGVRDKLDMHIQNMHDTALEVMTQEALGRVKVEGPGAFAKIWGDGMDEWYGAVVRHDMDTAKLAEQIKQGGNPALIDSQWKRMQQDGQRYWTRQWDRLEARMSGMTEGAKAAGLKLEGSEVTRNFKSWRKDWEGFFEFRNNTYQEFFDAQLAGKPTAQTWENISQELNTRYAKIADNEYKYAQTIDNSVAALLPPDKRELFLAWRNRINEWRKLDKVEVQAFRDGLRGIPFDDMQAAYAAHWQKRINSTTRIWQEERMGLAALQGNPDAMAAYQEGIARVQQFSAAEKEALQTAVKEGGFKDFKEATQAFLANPQDERFASLAPQVQAELQKQADLTGRVFQNQNFFPDFETLVKPEQSVGPALDQMIYTRGHDALDAMRDESLKLIKEPQLKWQDLGEETQQRLLRYVDHVKGGYSDARYASTRFGEFTRDSALLNYNRRFNYNTWLGTIMPYEFWTTQSMFKWALHSIDRPAMMTTYLRTKKFLETAYRPEEGLPSRLKGTVRVPLPFLPDWMQGQGFVDPLKLALPFDSWLGIPEQMEKQWTSDQGATTRKLEELLNDGQITQTEYNQATQGMKGPVWDRAMAMAQQDDSEQRLNGMDFAAMFSAPHAPLMWAMDKAQGRETGAIMPLTNTIGGVLGAFGLDPAGPLNPEAAIRKQLGFHPFNKWDDYYVERQLTNMVAEGAISASDAREAMISHKGNAYQQAYQRTWTEKTGGPAGLFLGLLGLPPKAYPQGEEMLRTVKDDYEAAWREYDKTGDYKSTVGKFTDEHPGYEERLALFKKPEERLQMFLADELWNQWNELPRLTQDEMKKQLGPEFRDAFIDKDTRSIESINPNTMAVWLKLMGGGDPYGQLKGQYIPPAQITDPRIANQAQVFYDTRNNMFEGWQELSDQYGKVGDGRVYVAPPDVVAFDQERKKRFGDKVYDLQDQYYALPKNARKGFREQHPELQQYWDFKHQFESEHPDAAAYLKSDAPITKSERAIWVDKHPLYKQYLDWRKSWLLRNSDVAPYVTDSLPKGIEDTYQNNTPLPNYTWDEWRGQLGWSLSNLVLDYDRGESLPPVAEEQLSKMADKLGWQGSVEQFAEHIAASQP